MSKRKKTAWLARDKSGDLCLYWGKKPYKDEVTNAWQNGTNYIESVSEDSLYNLSAGIDPQWEDIEPVEVELIINKI